jgi:hypothetical protein
VVVTLVVAMASIGFSATGAGAQSNGSPEIGVTAKEIHVATVADVDNPFAPGVFEGAKIGAEAAAKYLNSKAGGNGIGGRKIVVDFIDSKLNANESRNAVITACQQDFALVGTTMFFLPTGEDLVDCADQQGASVGLPDMPTIASSVQESCAPSTYALHPPQLQCATKDDAEQRYTTNAGAGRWFVAKHGKNELHGAIVYASDTKDAERASRSLVDAILATGIKADVYTGIAASTPQSGYTGIVAEMKAKGSNFAYGPTLLKSEAELQGTADGVTWLCQCYSRASADTPALDGTYSQIDQVPIEEADHNPMLRALVRAVDPEDIDAFVVYGWAAMVAFAQAARAVVQRDGTNGLTRTNFLTHGISTLGKFDAEGMIAPVDIAGRRPSPCYALVHLKNGTFTRVHPEKAGTFDCKPSNLVTIQADYVGG